MANQNSSYSQFILSAAEPMQASMFALQNMLDNPLTAGMAQIMDAIIPGLGSLPDLTEMSPMHPEAMFNHPATEWAQSGATYEDAINDLKTGTCYYRDAAFLDLIQCHHAHENKGNAETRAAAAEVREILETRYGTVYRKDWPKAFALALGDAYCLSAPLTPAWIGGTSNVPWGQYTTGLTNEQTLDAMRASCEGNRYDSTFWDDLTSLLLGLAGSTASAGSVDIPTLSLTDQDAHLRLPNGSLDALTSQTVDDTVWMTTGIRSLFNIPKYDELHLSPMMRTALGQPSIMISHAGVVPSLPEFVTGFLLMGFAVDPRYIECDTPDIVGNWSAVPDESCRVLQDRVQPIAAYIESLRAPHPEAGLGGSGGSGASLSVTEPSVSAARPVSESRVVRNNRPQRNIPRPVKPESRLARRIAALPVHVRPESLLDRRPWRGLSVFHRTCQGCHAGQQGQTRGVFAYSNVASEGAAPVPVCPPGVPTVEFTPGPPETATPNHCRPETPANDGPPFLGFIGTNASYARSFGPDPVTGDLVVEIVGEAETRVSQAVGSARLAGLQYREKLLHHGGVSSLEELLCMTGTRRETRAQRDTERCVRYDLDSPGALDAYKAGSGTCLQTWAPLRGHEFGCDSLTPRQKRRLLSYLKTL